MTARTAGGTGVVLQVVPWDDEDAARLRVEQQSELVALYEGDGDIAEIRPEQTLATVLATVDGEVAGCGTLREAAAYGKGYGELKRMFVRASHRGRGVSRLVLAELERIAAEAGLRRLILETGDLQVEAAGLYRSAGYRRIARYGPYEHDTRSLCYARWLVDAGTRVLVLNGTMGAGKTTVGFAISDLLREAERPHAWLDVDALCQVWPPPPEDPYAQGLVFESLTAIAPSLARRGLWHVVLPRVVEDAEDRERYEAAFDGAEVAIVRIVASEATRVARLMAREPEGYWQDLALARTRELDGVLTALALDDVVVGNDGRAAREVAREVLDTVGW